MVSGTRPVTVPPEPAPLPPRVVVSAAHSGAGKTTVATGLMRALRDEGLVVSNHKVGPDYIDPSWHAVATGGRPRNLDPWLVGEAQIAPLLAHAASVAGPQEEPADVAVIEGVMGLFDGKIGGRGFASTAHVAQQLAAPVVLVLDARRVTRSLAAVVHGFATYDPTVRVAGVIVNMVASARQADEIQDALDGVGVPVCGVIPKRKSAEVGSRHLGLVTAAEAAEADVAVTAMAELVREHVDLMALLKIAHAAPVQPVQAWTPACLGITRSTKHIVVCGGPAFTFYYAEHLELLAATGAHITWIDPRHDELPATCDLLLIGGGFPELYAAELSANVLVRQQIASAIADGVPTLAECGGYTYLCERLEGYPMVGSLAASAEMTPKLHIGYRDAVALNDGPMHRVGQRVHGHEFHRTQVVPADLAAVQHAYGWALHCDESQRDGFVTNSVLGTYLHQHWVGSDASLQSLATMMRT